MTTRAVFLALTPDTYLRDGFREDGHLSTKLIGEYATAAAVQLQEAEVAPQEFAFLFEALRQVLPRHQGAARDRLQRAVAEASETVRAIIGQANNRGLLAWLDACAAHVTSETDLEDLIAHVQAVLRQYTVFTAIRRA